jgi:hypothetical protein
MVVLLSAYKSPLIKGANIKPEKRAETKNFKSRMSDLSKQSKGHGRKLYFTPPFAKLLKLVAVKSRCTEKEKDFRMEEKLTF